ncbi:hypothetical protein QU38_02770, partial [Staphylococcus aureus]
VGSERHEIARRGDCVGQAHIAGDVQRQVARPRAQLADRGDLVGVAEADLAVGDGAQAVGGDDAALLDQVPRGLEPDVPRGDVAVQLQVGRPQVEIAAGADRPQRQEAVCAIGERDVARRAETRRAADRQRRRLSDRAGIGDQREVARRTEGGGVEIPVVAEQQVAGGSGERGAVDLVGAGQRQAGAGGAVGGAREGLGGRGPVGAGRPGKRGGCGPGRGRAPGGP